MKQITFARSITDRSETSLEKYLSEVRRIPVMDAEDEAVVARDAHKTGRVGDAARERLVTSNLRFVVSVAKCYQHMGLPLADLINEGNIGLITAASRFDETRGFRFISYAIWWVRESIIKAVSEKGGMVRRPLSAIAISGKLNKATEQFYQLNGRMPSADELSEIVSAEVSTIDEAMRGRVKVASMDKPLGDDEDMTYGDTFAAQVESTDRSADYSMMQKRLMAVIDGVLDRNEKKVVLAAFGIGCTERGIETIAGEMRLTKERVRQIKENALNKIRGCKAMKEFARCIA